MEDTAFRRLSVPEQIAEFYLAHYEELGAQSRKEMCALFDCSESTLRQAMVNGVKPRLRAQGKAMILAEGRNGYRVKPTDDLRRWRHSALSRLTAIVNEIRGYKADELSLADESDRRYFDDLLVGLELVHESLAVLIDSE